MISFFLLVGMDFFSCSGFEDEWLTWFPLYDFFAGAIGLRFVAFEEHVSVQRFFG